MSGPLRVVREGAVVRLTLDRPPWNVLSRELNRALAAAVREADADPAVAAIALDGGEARGFSAGVEVADHVPETIAGMLADFHGAIRALLAADVPTIAVLHGAALGGGLELALACDLAIAEAGTRLGFPEIRLGCYPPVAAALLPGRVGTARAAELVLGGDPFGAERAREMGLVNRVCPPGGREAALRELLQPLLEQSPAVLREAKRALREGAGAPALEALARIERRYLGDLMRLADAAEGVAAFLEKRAPLWANR